MTRKLDKIVDRFIKNTPRKGYVKDLRIKICQITHKLKSRIKAKSLNVYITTKSLKHMYDQRSAQEFDFIVSNIEKVVTNPHRIYKDKEGKTGNVCIYYEKNLNYYFIVIETNTTGNYVVSGYRLSTIEEKRKNYLAGYRLLWSWKGDLPSS